MIAKLFPNNEHVIERALRVILGIGLLSLVFIGPKTLWGLIGVVPLLTGAIGTCPLYTIFGFSTCKMPGKGETSVHTEGSTTTPA